MPPLPCKTLLLALLCVTVASTGGGCASLRKSGKAPPPPDTVVEVVNHSFPDVVLYIVTMGDPWRLGMVTGNGSAKFKVRASLLVGGTFQLLARPIAGRSFLIPSISVSPGDIVEVTIENSPGQSQISVSRPEP